jgi:hypothetical protein
MEMKSLVIFCYARDREIILSGNPFHARHLSQRREGKGREGKGEERRGE